MARLWQFLTNSRVLAVIGIAALAAVLLLGAESLEVAAIWAVLPACCCWPPGAAGGCARLAAQARQPPASARPWSPRHRPDGNDGKAAQR
jgi:hypothetical protein